MERGFALALSIACFGSLSDALRDSHAHAHTQQQTLDQSHGLNLNQHADLNLNSGLGVDLGLDLDVDLGLNLLSGARGKDSLLGDAHASACPGPFGRCSGNGFCSHGACFCDPEWTGIDCSLRTAPPKCVNGRFRKSGAVGAGNANTNVDVSVADLDLEGSSPSAAKCECIDGWTGPTCELKVCPGSGNGVGGGDCHGHGICVGTKCLCVAGAWRGDTQNCLFCLLRTQVLFFCCELVVRVCVS